MVCLSSVDWTAECGYKEQAGEDKSETRMCVGNVLGFVGVHAEGVVEGESVGLHGVVLKGVRLEGGDAQSMAQQKFAI